jgi:hypothetical protein
VVLQETTCAWTDSVREDRIQLSKSWSWRCQLTYAWLIERVPVGDDIVCGGEAVESR